MRSLLPVFCLLALTGFVAAPEPSLKTVLVDQLKTTHNQKEWFVPVNTALEGVTADQAMWSDKSGNHSVGQLAHHLLFWNQRQLEKFKGVKSAAFSGNNDETFTAFDKSGWTKEIADLDKVMQEIEATVAGANDKQLAEWAPSIANISTHNAYHTGQIIFIRRLQGSWNPDKGVK